jgi:3-phenylpropionate/trans-cinnamate dioxygenase ferredoxin reductase component
MVIIGAGEAGAWAAITLREEGWTGPITLVGEELHAPYERPPLSKTLLIKEKVPCQSWTLTPVRMNDLAIHHITGAEAVKIDRCDRAVYLADGRKLRYHRLLLATGAAPRRLALSGPCEAARGMLYLRRFEEALAIRERLSAGSHVIIIGGGFIGLEVAAAVTSWNAEVTLIEVAPRILMRGIPASLAELIERRHRAAGINLSTGVGLTEIGSSPKGIAVVLADGTRIVADTVVIGVGVTPRTDLAVSAGLLVNNGIAVNEHLETSDPNVFAAGDCCSAPHPLYGGKRIRLEAWRNAQEQGTLAARNMLGRHLIHDTVPWFWSDQYEVCLQVAGLPEAGAQTLERPIGTGARLLFHLDGGGRLVAASGVGPAGSMAKKIKVAQMLIARRAVPDPHALVSPAVDLKELLAA